MPRRSVAGVLLLAFVLAGCAGRAHGRNFTRAPADALILGNTTYQEIVSRMGPPLSEGDTVRRAQVVRDAFYDYWVGQYEHAQQFLFFEHVLVGYVFTSSFPEESTNFDALSVHRIRKGETTEAEVLTLLGTPSGRFIYPFIYDKEGRGLGWFYAPPYRDEASRTWKWVLITVDARGLVTDIESKIRGPQ